MSEPFRHTLRVRYGECDAQGVLFNANYLAYIDHTITEMWRAAFGGYGQMLAQGVDIVVAECNLGFRAAARFEDEVEIEVWVSNLGTTSITTTYRFLRGAELLMEGWVRHVFVETAHAGKTPIPGWARAGLARWQPPPGPAGV